jgi:hypothetical protein
MNFWAYKYGFQKKGTMQRKKRENLIMQERLITDIMSNSTTNHPKKSAQLYPSMSKKKLSENLISPLPSPFLLSMFCP